MHATVRSYCERHKEVNLQFNVKWLPFVRSAKAPRLAFNLSNLLWSYCCCDINSDEWPQLRPHWRRRIGRYRHNVFRRPLGICDELREKKIQAWIVDKIDLGQTGSASTGSESENRCRSSVTAGLGKRGGTAIPAPKR